MILNKKDDEVTFTKELDPMEKYFLNILKRYFETDERFLQESCEAIITEAVKRSKKEIINNIKSVMQNNACTSVTLPDNPMPGDGPYFDLTSKKPIWFDGQSWIYADGQIAYRGDNND